MEEDKASPWSVLGPHRINIKASRRYLWCSCGRSENQPLCDGSHEGTSFLPVAYKPVENLTAAFRGCKLTKGPPFCDGSHVHATRDANGQAIKGET
jgi:CDGSH-type Zn-finger protein